MLGRMTSIEAEIGERPVSLQYITNEIRYKIWQTPESPSCFSFLAKSGKGTPVDGDEDILR